MGLQARLFARDKQLTTTLLDSLRAVLSQPVAGIVLGLVLAAAFFNHSRSSFSKMTPQTSSHGLLLVALALLGRLFAAVVILWIYRALAPSGFLPFALCFAGGFVVLYTFEAVRYSGLTKRRGLRREVAQGR